MHFAEFYREFAQQNGELIAQSAFQMITQFSGLKLNIIFSEKRHFLKTISIDFFRWSALVKTTKHDV